MSSLTANMISADLDAFKTSMAQSQYNSGHYATVTHYRWGFKIRNYTELLPHILKSSTFKFHCWFDPELNMSLTTAFPISYLKLSLVI